MVRRTFKNNLVVYTGRGVKRGIPVIGYALYAEKLRTGNVRSFLYAAMGRKTGRAETTAVIPRPALTLVVGIRLPLRCRRGKLVHRFSCTRIALQKCAVHEYI